MVVFWVAALAINIVLYVFQDGVVLGVGMLFGLTRDDRSRKVMLGAVAPLRGGSEIWLISAGLVLWAAFPIAYAVLISAFYLPLLVMLAGLILRCAAFALRCRYERARRIWDATFFCASLLVAFMQGSMFGALVEGLPVVGNRYIGDEFSWFSLFSFLCGLGLCFGYGLLGACWLFRKCEYSVREQARLAIPNLAGGLFAFYVFLGFYTLVDFHVMSRWLERPYLFVFPAIGAVPAIVLALTERHVRREVPLYLAMAVFVAAFATLAISLWPYMIPFALTIDNAVAPLSGLAFVFWVGVNVLAPILIYGVTNRAFVGLAAYRFSSEGTPESVAGNRGRQRIHSTV
jgi:cytochrome d ubiquinol oxidase subunit II